MTAPADDVQSGIEVAADADLPTKKLKCPYCGKVGPAQQLFDAPDEQATAADPVYGCSNLPDCGAEFAVA